MVKGSCAGSTISLVDSLDKGADPDSSFDGEIVSMTFELEFDAVNEGL